MCEKPKIPVNQINVDYEGCKTGWIGYGKRCYKFEQDPKDYATAKTRCNGKGGVLVTAFDDVTNAWIHSKIGENEMDHHDYWIGLYSTAPGNFRDY